MSQDLETTTVAQPGEQLSWSEVWITAVIRPSTETYERILQDPQASTGRAYRWVFLGSLIGYAISILISFIITSFDIDSLGGFGLGGLFSGSAPIALIREASSSVIMLKKSTFFNTSRKKGRNLR